MEVKEARALFASKIKPMKEVSEVSLFDAYNLVSAFDIKAETDVPSFPRSAMDGYAVKADELRFATHNNPVELRVAEEVNAGDVPRKPYEKGTAVRIMTGAMIPFGYDAVVKQEDTDRGEDTVRVYKEIKALDNYCPVGENANQGSVVVRAGELLDRGRIGMLASLGLGKVTTVKKPSVAIIATGSELTPPGGKLKHGSIYANITHMLSSCVYGSGCAVGFSKICADNIIEITDALTEALETCDFVVTTGGVSVGKRDLVPRVLNNLNAEIIFSHVNIKPGTPTMGCLVEGKPVLSLSGNPYAAIVNFDLYFYNAIAALTGCSEYKPEEGYAILKDKYDKIDSLRRYLRAKEGFGEVYLPHGSNKSSVVSNLAGCNCYIEVPPMTPLKTGSRVKIVKMKVH